LIDSSGSGFSIQEFKLLVHLRQIYVAEYPMNEHDSFSDSIYEEQIHLAERELASFITAVTKLYGPQQAGLSAEDWLDESELMDSAPRSEARNWRAVTIAASARLANRVDARAAAGQAPRRIDD
jgi:hypothetical protein